MSVLLGISLLLFGAGFFARQAGQLPQRAWAGPRTAAQRQRGAAKPRSVRQEIRLTWEKARAQDWLAQRGHDRKNGAQPAAALSTVRPRPLASLAAARQRRQARGAHGGSAPVTVIPAQAPSAAPPAARSAASGGAPTTITPANGSPGRNATVTATGNAVEQFVEGVNQIHAHAQAGGLHAKHGAVKASHEGCARFAAMAAMLSRAMSEPGQHYGPEITEPVAKAGVHLQAAAMSFSEADGALTSLENMTVGDLAASSRQAPHHSELTDSGSH